MNEDTEPHPFSEHREPEECPLTFAVLGKHLAVAIDNDPNRATYLNREHAEEAKRRFDAAFAELMRT